MATEYHFQGTGIDATVITDAARGSKTFNIVDISGVDENDVMAGIDVGIEEYTESDLIQIAMNNNFDLDRIDPTGLTCLVVPGAAAGRFNGTTSKLRYTNVPLASSGSVAWPLTFKVTYRLTQEDINFYRSQRLISVSLFATDITQQGFIGLFLSFNPRGEGYFFGLTPATAEDFGNLPEFMQSVDRCMPITIVIDYDGTNTSSTVFVNDMMIDRAVIPGQVTLPIDNFIFEFGATPSGAVSDSFFRGIMRQLIISDANGDIINTPDPSTGVNTGSAGNGTVTDITSVSVIV